VAEGEVVRIEESPGHVVMVAGRLRLPEEGSFFFRRQSVAGIAGSHVGVVQLPGSGRAFRLEPAAADGSPELVARRLDEVVCVKYAMPPGSGQSAEEASTGAESAGGDVQEAPVVDVGQHPTIPIPDYQNGVPVLESLPGARAVIYLDFDGETTTQWNGELIVARKPSFTATQIREIWRHAAADFIQFTVNLTTDIRVFERATESSRVRVIITPTTDAAPGAGGVAFIGSWNWTGDVPCWAFGSTVKDAAEQISHEVGHVLGLSHDRRQLPGGGIEEYYGGHGSGEVGWAPIMGVGYGQPVVQWSKGEYANALNREDDLQIMTAGNGGVGYRPDQQGASFGASRPLEIYPGGSVTNQGIIERNTDVDAFRFTTLGGSVNLTARPASVSPNLAIRLELTDDTDRLLLAASPTGTLRASLATNLPAGSYAIKVRGSGRGANGSVGFTAYASLGSYQLTGTVASSVEPIRFRIAEHSPAGTAVGDLASHAAHPGPREFVAVGGNSAGVFALGPDGELTVEDSSRLDFEVQEQFELLVDIRYPDDPSLDEIQRRVVVHVTDVNESPEVSSLPVRLYDRTLQGTLVASLTASDPDLYTRLRFGIVSGDAEGRFAINGSGELRLARDLDTGPTHIVLRVEAWDAGTPALTNRTDIAVEVLATPVNLRPGRIAFARYDGIPGSTMASLTNHPSFPRSPSSLLTLTNAEMPIRTGDNYGGAIRGYFLPPVTGNYVFAVAGDDACELRISTGDRPEDARRVAFSSTFTDPHRWTQYASQRSAPLALEAGQAYYLEARVKESEGGDHLSVAWQNSAAGAPTLQLLPGRYLAPYEMDYAPRLDTGTVRLHRNAFSGARFSRVEATDAGGDTEFTYELVSASVPGVVAVDRADGWLRVADGAQLGAVTASSVSLRIRVADPGGNSATGAITCTLLGENALGTTAPSGEIFRNIGSGTAVGTLTNNARYPRRPDALEPLTDKFALRRNFGNAYGSRIRALLVAPTAGSYRFHIASDDSSELWLGTSTNAATARVIARVAGAVGPEQWTAQPGQRSTSVNLAANQRYYIETRHKEGGGDDHVAVAWVLPGTAEPVAIPASVLRPVDLGFAPVLSDASAAFPSGVPEGAVVADMEATDGPLDVLAWRIADGDPERIFGIKVDTGEVFVADRQALLASANESWQLQVEVQDSGYGGLYPRKSAVATLTLQRIAGGSPFEQWAEASGIPGARPEDDGDHDGMVNLLEFAMGGDPREADADLLRLRISIVSDGGASWVHLTHRRRQDASAIGLSYAPLAAEAPLTPNWQPTELSSIGFAPSTEGLPPGYESITVRLAEPVPASASARFYRLEISLPEASGP